MGFTLHLNTFVYEKWIFEKDHPEAGVSEIGFDNPTIGSCGYRDVEDNAMSFSPFMWARLLTLARQYVGRFPEVGEVVLDQLERGNRIFNDFLKEGVTPLQVILPLEALRIADGLEEVLTDISDHPLKPPCDECKNPTDVELSRDYVRDVIEFLRSVTSHGPQAFFLLDGHN